MANIQDIFNRIQETKKEQKVIKAIYRDAFANSGRYQEVKERLEKLKEEKKRIEQSIKDDLKAEIHKLETFKQEIETDNLLLSDLAINKIMKGESIEVTDEHSNKYEPIFSVKFKKM